MNLVHVCGDLQDFRLLWRFVRQCAAGNVRRHRMGRPCLTAGAGPRRRSAKPFGRPRAVPATAVTLSDLADACGHLELGVSWVRCLLLGGLMIVTIVGAGRLAEGVAVRALAGGHRLRVVDSEPGKADTLTANLAARGERRGPPEFAVPSR